MPRQYLIGFGAGVISATLVGAAAVSKALAGILLYLAPLPLCLAGFGWGSRAALVAALAGGLVMALSFGPVAGIVFLIFLGAPFAFFCRLMLLSRAPENQEGVGAIAVEWYPASRLVGWAAVIAGVLATFAIVALGFDDTALRETIQSELQGATGAALDPEGTLLTPENIETLSRTLAKMMPAIFSVGWLTTALLNLWIGGMIVEASGRALRPWPQLDALELPNAVFFALVGSLAASFLPGQMGLIGTAFAGAFLLAFVLQGLAVIHAATRGMSTRGLILAAVYVGIFIFGWPAIVVAILGIAEPMLNLRGRAANRNTPD
ncbi:hypothetical protein A7A08_00238 [Methyloligella halotolerans]|uniref:DUF2232 domain-containing protein n=1 Tax=Methyloligella halotolerans TaxID=1177755 RepID=A0A1E2S256_9HYPH|nr:DUF2232 domain-containing protein [Methyloligella halotolerans]ODA68415.1 hypothetical protein A7A08_00238 [Methyloligella halotolerans]